MKPSVAAAIVVLCLASQSAFAEFPESGSVIKIFVPYGAGGQTDQVARISSEVAAHILGTKVIIENRAGGAGAIAANAVKSAQPDGYSLFMADSGTHGINSAIYDKLSYDPIKDFEPVVQLISVPLLLVVPVNSKYKSLEELIAAARAKPGSISFASPGVGTGAHLLGELIKSANKVDLVHIPYKGGAALIPDLISGRVDFSLGSLASYLQLVQEGKTRALAVTDSKRVPSLPGVPTVAETGHPYLSVNLWFGLVAPANTPKPIIDKLNDAYSKAMMTPSVMQRINSLGADVVVGSPDDLKKLIQTDIDRYGPIAKNAGISVQ